MAIESSNRSPSPMSFRQSPNPNFSDSRNHSDKRGETGVRRSANGSPFPKPSVVAHPSAWCFTPKTTIANSPAEIGRKNSFSNMNEHKENKKPTPNLKPIKGTKNFMSPTISAVSKVNPSPRKKALAERNEAVRTSASLSDGKFLFFAGAGDDDLKSEAESCEFQEETHVSTFGAKKRVTFDDDVVVLSPEVFPGYDVDDDDNDDVESLFATQMIEPSLVISKTTSFVSLASPTAPLDADPFVQPYDPKTNFLSPRPQFLRYKPPEEISLNLNSHLLKTFEDTLSSETCSDNDVESSVEEAQSEEEESPLQEEILGSSNSSTLAKLESSGEQEKEVSVESDDEESSDETEISSEPRFFRRWRAITWLLFGALLSSLIVRHAPPEGADFSGSLHRMKELSTTYLPLMISSFGETDEFTPSEFLNFSASICDANDHFVEHKAPGFLSGEKYLTEISDVQEEMEMDSDSKEMAFLQPEQDSLEQDQFIEESGQVEVDYSEEEQFIEESVQVVQVNYSEEENTEESGQVEVDYSEEYKFIEESDLEVDYSEEEQFIEESVQVVQVNYSEEENTEESGQVEVDYSEEFKFIEESDLASHPNVDSNHEEAEPELEMDVASEQTQFTEQTEKEDEVDLEESTSYNTIVESGRSVASPQDAVIFIVATLGAAATAISALVMFSKYKKKKAGVEPNFTKPAELLTRKEDSLYAAAESCNPSEMSSYSYSFYDNKREEEEARGSDNEAQSKEERKQKSRRNNKRESLASSSSEYSRGSVSYGSFTTYSVIPTKKGDENVVTPVRRSSRISKQLVTP